MTNTIFTIKTIAGNQIYDLPSAFKNICAVYLVADNMRSEMDRAHWSAIEKLHRQPEWKGVMTFPSAYCLNSNSMRIWPTPDKEYEIDFHLYDSGLEIQEE